MSLDRINLKPAEIHFFYSLVEEITDPLLLARCRSVLSEGEKIKTDRYVFEKDKSASLITRSLLRFVLSVCTGLPSEDFEFIENPYGKPALRPGLVPIPIKFNVSHSSGVTACALTMDNEIGVDIENYKRKIDLSIADRYFIRSELEYIRKAPAEDRHAAFFDIWTLKESYIKARGMGLSMDLDKFGFEIDRQTAIYFDKSVDDVPEQWKFFRFSPVENYRAAISIQSQAACKLNIYKCIPFIKIEQVNCISLGLFPPGT